MKISHLSPDQLTVLPVIAERSTSRVADSFLRNSIEKGGIQQPLIAVRDGERILLVKGMRRLRIAQALDLKRVPVLVYEVPAGDAEKYVKELRFVLFHRQDLMPSQKAQLVTTLKDRFKMTNSQVAAYLGIASDSVTNWQAAQRYLKPIVDAMDAGQLTMQAARVFDGMTETGQKTVWKTHGKDLMLNGANAHKKYRALYPPASYPAFYHDPNLITRRLKMKGGKRTRGGMSAGEKRRLVGSYELREIELREGRAELATLKAQITAAVPLVAATLRNDDALACVPDEMGPELERFGEAYV